MSLKFLSPNQMTMLLPATIEVEEKAETKFSVLLTRASGDKERLKRLTKNGTLRTAQINLGVSPVGIFWYRIEDGRLIVDTLISVDNTVSLFPLAIEALREIATVNQCHCVEGVAARAGVVNAWMDQGAQAVGVVLRKDL